jgi:hypothetical protein
VKSKFTSDLRKEKQFSHFLDVYYEKYLVYYDALRVHDMKSQMAGIDLLFTHKQTKVVYNIDEKAQLDYINEDLPTFAFELGYYKEEVYKEGWLFNIHKKTDFYSLSTAIYEDEPNIFTSCKITLVNRKMLLDFLRTKTITKEVLTGYCDINIEHHGKLKIKELNTRTEGYLYISKNNKSEKPINLILKLDFLIAHGIAKRLV